MAQFRDRAAAIRTLTRREARRSNGFAIGYVFEASDDGLLEVKVRGRAQARKSVAQMFDDGLEGGPVLILGSDRGASMDVSAGYSPWVGPGLVV